MWNTYLTAVHSRNEYKVKSTARIVWINDVTEYAHHEFDKSSKYNWTYTARVKMQLLKFLSRTSSTYPHGKYRGLLFHLITHNDPQQSVGLLRTSDWPVAETSSWQHTTLTTDVHATGRIFFFVFSCILYFIRTCSLSWLPCILSSLTTHNITSTTPTGLEPATPASDRPPTLALNR